MEKYYVNVGKLCTKWFSDPERKVLHRVGAPACEYADGDYSWWLNDNRHCASGPAICLNGRKEWYVNGKQHRVDGPAIEYPSGDKRWYLDGEEISEQEHTRRTAPAREMTVAQIEAALGKRVKINLENKLILIKLYSIINSLKGKRMTHVIAETFDKNGTLTERRWFKDNGCTILHCADGPAIENFNGDRNWFLDDEELTEEEHAERMLTY